MGSALRTHLSGKRQHRQRPLNRFSHEIQAMEHRGYTGVSFVDEESESLYGHVIGLRDVITFQGDSVAELSQSFRDSVDDYLEFCQSLGRSPEKPYSGRFLLRIPPALHRALSNAAEKTGVSINSLIESILESATAAKDWINREPAQKAAASQLVGKYQMPGPPSLSGKDTRKAKPKVRKSSPKR
jgi:predicted HicB family RNase H-like nuclease